MSKAFETLAELLLEQYQVSEELIREDTVVTDLGLDSLTLMEFIFDAEDKFSLRIPEDKLDPHQAGLTLGEICKVIEALEPAKK
jgi:acyl carrier protein